MPFEVFRKRMVPLTKAPYVTIQVRGTLSFNMAAHAAMGAPEAIELLYDPIERIIGVRGIDPAAEHAYPIRSSGGGKQAGRSFVVSGQAFTKFYGIETEVSRRYPAVMQEGVLCIDLKQEGTVVTSNRAGHKKTAQPAPTLEVTIADDLGVVPKVEGVDMRLLP